MDIQGKSNLAKAIISVMKTVKSVHKNMTVGTGKSAYQGVADEDVKETIGQAMEDNGICILPISVKANTKVERWQETDNYGTKTKQSIFTEATTRYLLLHESGESIELEGYGQGVDSQDKGAGKATTYALKNTLLYSFMVPTKKIDDTDKTHSDDMPVKPIEDKRPWLNPNTPQWNDAITYLKGEGTIDKISKKYRISKDNEEKLKQDVL